MVRLRPLLLLLLCMLIGIRPLYAHGGGELVVGLQSTGPYAVSVWLNPPQARVSEPLHFTVGLADLDSGDPVLDANIEITMQQVGNDTAVSAPATTAQSTNKLFYETDLTVFAPGNYQVLIEINGLEGMGQIELAVVVAEAQSDPINWLVIGLVGIVLVVVLGRLRVFTHKVNSKKNN